METKVATAIAIFAFFASSSVFHSPVEAFPTGQELKAYPISSSTNDIDCSGSKDGEKIPSPNSCSEFYECVHGVAYLFRCANMTDGGQLYFNATLQSCNWPWEVDCEITSTEPTTVTEPSNNSTPEENDQLLRVYATMADTTVDCSQAENGDKIASPTNCSEYYVCVMGRAYLYQCPIIAAGGRLYFDPELGVCNWPWMVDCEITTTESPSTTTMVTEPSSTTTVEPVSTTTSQMNSTTLNPTTEVTTVSINTTTVEPITSEIPQTSTQPDDLSTTPEVSSSQPLSTTTTQKSINTTTQEVTETSTTIVDSTTAEHTTSHVDSTTADAKTTEASTPAINTTTMKPITSENPETSSQPDDSSTTSEQPSSTDIPVSSTTI